MYISDVDVTADWWLLCLTGGQLDVCMSSCDWPESYDVVSQCTQFCLLQVYLAEAAVQMNFSSSTWCTTVSSLCLEEQEQDTTM